jgi:hypothetical protein
MRAPTACAAAILLGACAHEAEVELRFPRVTMAIIERVDLDDDGSVSKAEYAQLAFPDEPMDPWDADHDEALDAAEIEQAFLRADPTWIQLEGRRAVYQKYGYPFGEPVAPKSQRLPGDPEGAKAVPELDPKKYRLRNRRER